MQVPDVYVIRAQFLQTGIDMREGVGFVAGAGLGGKDDVLAPVLQGRPNHALVVAALVAARRIEVGNPDIGGAFDDAAVRSDHAAEADGRDLDRKSTRLNSSH